VKQPEIKLRAWLSGIGAVVALLFGGSALQAGPMDDAQKIEVRIPSGDAVLAATLYRPAGAKGNLPAVVVGHGSGKVPRKKGAFWIDAALSSGLAALAYDKRGVGESTGTFMEWEVEKTPQIFQQLATDMIHAARWLSTQQGIDRNRVGLMGGSQAGWIMPLAASQEPMIKFVIVGEGVPLPAGIEEVHGSYLNKVGSESNPTLRQVTTADATAMDYDGPRGYDPAPVLEKLDIPVLWIFGLYDGVIPVRQSIDRIGELQKAGKLNHSVHIFPFGNHGFSNVFTGFPYNVAEVSRAWLRMTGLMDREYLEELKKGASDEHARIAWTTQILEARLSPPRLTPAGLQALLGRYEGGHTVLQRDGRVFIRRPDGMERELVPLARDLFGLGEAASPLRVRFNRTKGVVGSASFVEVTGPRGGSIARERP
jgi:dienelactone hydrolase